MFKPFASQKMRTFLLIWLGQFVSLVGTSLTGFALGVYVFQQTGETTGLALVWLFVTLPNILISPLAGVLVDRWDRRWAMILSDTGGALSTLLLAVLLSTGRLEIWHIYLATALGSGFSAFQWPAYAASVSLLVPQEHLGRANGLMELAGAVSGVAAPLLAGILISIVGLQGIILIDFATFFLALSTLMFVRIPRPPISEEGRSAQGTFWHEAIYGWRFVRVRPGLLGLLILDAAIMVLGGGTEVLITPLVLSFESADALGFVLSSGGVGLVVGGLVMSAWGGPERRVAGIVAFELVAGTATLVAGLRASIPLIAGAIFVLFSTYPILASFNRSIWQSKVPPDVQGRVFATNRVVSWLPLPLVFLGAGPLVDHVMEPLLLEGGALANTVGAITGTGPGRGIGLIFVIAGALNVLAAIAAYLHPRIRHVEDELPDVVQRELTAT